MKPQVESKVPPIYQMNRSNAVSFVVITLLWTLVLEICLLWVGIDNILLLVAGVWGAWYSGPRIYTSLQYLREVRRFRKELDQHEQE